MNATSPPGHRHAATLEDSFDFLNTDELDGAGHPIEGLPSLPDATGWLVDRGMLHPEQRATIEGSKPSPAGVPLARVHAARAALRGIVEALVADRPADPDDLAAVNAVLQARSVPELVPGDGTLAIGHRHVGDPLDDALGGLAEPLVSLIAAGDVWRLRICANDGCRWVFHDTSRTGRRRWCSMASCGNRAKAARHRARKRIAAAPSAADVGPTPA